MYTVLCWFYVFGVVCVFSLKELVIPVGSISPVVEPIQPQLSPGVSTIKMEAPYPGSCFAL